MGILIDSDELKEFILKGKEIAKHGIDISKLFGLKEDEMRYEGYDKAFDYVLEHIKAKELEDATKD